MADPSFLMQGFKKNNDHENALINLLNLEEIEKVIFSVAFVRESGVSLISKKIKPLSSKMLLYIGIRNGITSAQGLKALLKTKSTIYAVDTGSSNTIFHPKVYLAYNNKEAKVIVGSANLTNNGLNENIEASTVLKLDRNDKLDEDYLNDLITTITTLQEKYLEHVFQVKNEKDIEELLQQGRIEDERLYKPSTTNIIKTGIKRDKLKRIKLYRKKRRLAVSKPVGKKKTKVINRWVFVWESKGLTERDLNIPTGAGTHATGSMLLTKGRIDEIDQRHYFRDKVFEDLKWKFDSTPRLSHLERAEALFEVIVKGVSYGSFKLKLTHNSRTDTRAYEQKNAMTQIHWGKAKEIIAQRDLLNRELRLYKKIGKDFVIEID